MIQSEKSRIEEAYRQMASRIRYRPAAPGNGLGNIWLSEEELADPERLAREAAFYATRFIAEEDDGSFALGVSNFATNRALVYTIEAARLLNGADNSRALLLLAMAREEILKAAAKK
jgi:hypothetical protein